jgi:hypothetical protein
MQMMVFSEQFKCSRCSLEYVLEGRRDPTAEAGSGLPDFTCACGAVNRRYTVLGGVVWGSVGRGR